MTRPTRTLAARYLLPVEGDPIPDGLIEIQDGRIAEIGPRAGRSADLDLGNVAIVPGFVNAHTHLELPPLDDPAGPGPENEIAWLGRVIAQRRRSSPDHQKKLVATHLAEAIAAGTTLLADITTAGLSWEAVSQAPLRSVVFAELIGLKRSRGLETNQEAWEWLGSVAPPPDGRARPGLSPHAPYSTAGWLYHRAAGSRMPLTTHLAEMPEELELLETRSGPLRDFLERLNAWDDDFSPIGSHPADYVRKGDLRQADWLIAHGTYLDPSDYWQFRPEAAPDRQRVAIAYCPRTTERFGHGPHPFRDLLAHGVVVCVGTDSRASAPSLSILDELRFLHRAHPDLGGRLLLTMGTLFGAWALRSEESTGSLKKGKSADLAIVGLPDRDSDDPYRLLFESDRAVLGTVFEGRFVAGRWAE